MSPTFYFAIGARHRRRDLTVAILVGQREFLVPAGSPGAALVRAEPRTRVVLDSWAWPPNNPDRLSLAAYWREVQTWRAADGSWRCDWFASYDTIGNPAQSQRDYRALLALMVEADLATAPLVPVTHYPGPGVSDILIDFQLGHAGTRGDLTANDGTLDRPGYGIGGLVPARYSCAAEAWYTELLTQIDAATDPDADDDAALSGELLGLHLFGVGKPTWVLQSSLVQSFDSSGPAQLARFGWPKIAPVYHERYGFSPKKLAMSREARLAYWLVHYRSSIGLSWQPIDEALLLDDGERMADGSPVRQLSLFASAA